MESDRAIKVLEDLMKEKQKNQTIKNTSEEVLFLTGGIAMIHELTKHNNKDENKMECYPPRFWVAAMRGISVNGFKYQENKQCEQYQEGE